MKRTMTIKRIAFIPDLQAPFVHEASVKSVGKFLQKFKPHQTICIGDEIDLPQLGGFAARKAEFDQRNTKIIGLSVDPVDRHAGWAADIKETQGAAPKSPMIGDTDLAVAKLYNMLPADEAGSSDGRTAATNATVRSVFIIGPDKKIKAMLTYPMSTGRNFDEVLRLLESCQLTAKHQVATPVNWKKGEDVIIVPAVSDEAAKAKYPNGWKAPKPYLRIVPMPK